MTNKGSEKPWLASWGDYRQVVLKSLWRKLCRTFISISNEVWLRFSPQRAMFDWSFDSGLQDTTGYNQIHDQQGFLQTCLIFVALGYYTWFHDLGWTYLVFMVLGSAKLSFLYYYNILLIFFCIIFWHLSQKVRKLQKCYAPCWKAESLSFPFM